MEDLSTTSYAILGLLAVQPWTTYELAKQMDRALGSFWPRTRSHLYSEPKKLVTLGLATAAKEATGRRPRTVYTITPAGQRALEQWMTTTGAGPVVEFEQLVQVFFAEHGSRAQLLASLDDMRVWVEERAALGTDIPREYLEGRGPYPERLPWLILVGKFLDELETTVDRWAEWATSVVETWPDDLGEAEPDWPALEEMTQRSEALARRAADRRRSQHG